MVVERPLTFAEQVKADLERRANENLKNLEAMLVDFQEEYDANLVLLNNLGIVDQLKQAAKNIADVTKRRAEVIISPCPCISYAPDDPFHKYIKGDKDCEIELQWEPSGTRGVEFKIAVKASGGKKVQIRSAKSVHAFGEEEYLNEKTLNEAIFEAYKHPLRSDQHH